LGFCPPFNKKKIAHNLFVKKKKNLPIISEKLVQTQEKTELMIKSFKSTSRVVGLV
jgi:hypothetical protein